MIHSKRFFRGVMVTGLVVAAAAAQADGFGLRFSDDVVEASYEHFVRAGNASFEGRYLRNSDEDVDLLSGGFFVHGTRDELSGKLGVKAYYADFEDDDGYGAALGGEGRFRFSDVVSLTAGLYIGPDVLSFSDVEEYSEWFVGADFAVFQNAVINVGYRETEVEVERGRGSRDLEIEDGVYVGLNLRF